LSPTAQLGCAHALIESG